MIVQRPSGFIEPCLPSKVFRPPSGPLWVHEIKHDGYRLMVRRDGSRVRCFTRNGHDWAMHCGASAEAMRRCYDAVSKRTYVRTYAPVSQRAVEDVAQVIEPGGRDHL